MKNILFICFAFVFALAANATEKPKTVLGGGKILGNARLVGLNSKAVIITCDKSKNVCMYVLKASGEETEDICKVSEPWRVPPTAEQQYNRDYPFAFSFNTDVLTFYPANSISIGCRNQEGVLEIKIDTPAEVKFP